MQWFSFSRSERRLWPWLLLIAMATGGVAVWTGSRDDTDTPSPLDADSQAAYDKLLRLDKSVRPDEKDTPAGQTGKLKPFYPNTDDSLTLERAGLRHRLVKTLLHYRTAGGRFHSAGDVQRLYGLQQGEFERLRPYIRIRASERGEAKPLPSSKASQHLEQKGSGYPRIEKLREGEKIDLATADTNELKRIPGIGSYRARSIVGYGKRLGGFVSVAQICEIGSLPPGVENYLVVRRAAPHRIDLNSASFSEMLRHPYLSYQQVRAILNRRKKFGPLSHLQQLSTDSAFQTADLQRLTPYVTFGH